MEKLNLLSFLCIIVLFLRVTRSLTTSLRDYDTFLECLQSHTSSSDQVSNIVYAQTNASYTSILEAFVRNSRFNTPSTPKPLLIITPFSEHQVQATVVCAKSVGLQLRIRSGGHDFEGASYVSQVPFVILDMFNFQNVTVDIQNEVAVIQSGASLGQVYYRIWEKSEVHGFAAGACPTIGVGGHLSGGGYGSMIRKYGLSVDHVIDAKIVDVKGRILDKKAMGEDLFWTIKGGGGASFGVILSYTVKLVQVPEKVTVFKVDNTLEQNATDLVFEWQHVAPHTDDRLFMRMTLQPVISEGNKTIRASIKALFLGGANELVTLLEKEFPLLRLKKETCKEMRWIDSVLWLMNDNHGSSLEVLLDRSRYSKYFNKIKSDYVQTPISKDGLKWIWKKMIELGNTQLIFIPYGGKMNEVPSDATPFPHRAGNLYKIQYNVSWQEPGAVAEKNLMDQIRKLYSYMTLFVSKNPRRAFLNYRDLDIGINSHGEDNYEDGKVFGVKYFDKNFQRLVKVKTAIDPENFFWNEQSMPTLPAIKQQVENITDKRKIGYFN
ncbi:hypothetical protein Fmac_004998 [Flemingia macrophylla]|uniref:FAD-binding PCMH-type domain-containing protein n=1 Tax=Flemingia macrophylla TaxID=520843 RepID=A0ABD1N7V6_9FABA